MSQGPGLALPLPIAVTDPADGRLVVARRLWPLLLIGWLSNMPIYAASVFIVAMAVTLDSTPAIVGGLRGLGGVAALATGVLVAPVLDRWPRRWTVVGSLVCLSIATALLSLGVLPLLVLFYLLSAAAMNVLMPVLQAASSDGLTARSGGWATSLMSAVQVLGQGMSGVALLLPAVLWGWQGAFALSAGGIALLALLAARTGARSRPAGRMRLSYLATFREVAAAPGALALLLCALLRSIGHLGAWITYLGALFTQQLGAETGVVAWVYLLAGISAFGGLLLAGWLLESTTARLSWWRPERSLVAGLALLLVTETAIYLAPTVALAVALVPLIALGFGLSQAAMLGLIVARYPALRGALLALTAAAQNLGLFVGAALGGLALGLAGYPGIAAVIALLLGSAVLVALWAVKAPAPRAA